jgi:hypothetical protein
MSKNLHIIHRLKISARLALTCLAIGGGVWAPLATHAQAVTGIVTDYNGFWKTSTSSINPVKPDNHHNLLSFTFNGTQYSTGVNDALLTSHGETFVPGQFQALPLQNIANAPTSNTKIGLGAMVDGVANGRGATWPSRTMGPYLNDGANGLDLGTCVANLPAGTMFLSVSNLQAAKIGDGIPDILVTQIADPSSSYDSYEFTDVNGNRIGNSLNVVLTNIAPVGGWMADFYEASTDALTSGFTQTPRDIRLWTLDFSAFGINASNIGNIAYFKINLNGNSDIAFVAYNSTTVTVQQVLDLNTVPARVSRANQEQPANALSVYPNPASGMVNFSHPKAVKDDRIIVYGMSGVAIKQIIPSVNSTHTALNVSSLARGAFQVVYVGKQGKLSKKLMVQ